MGRLIDADKVIKKINEMVADNEWMLNQFNADFIESFIDEQPTAYDADKVVEQLKENSKMIYRKITTEDECEDDEELLDMVYEYVINSSNAQFIVRKGGKE